MSIKVFPASAKRAIEVLESFDGEVDMAISESRAALRYLTGGGLTDRIGIGAINALMWLRMGLTLGTYDKRLASLQLVAAEGMAA